jgi:hypothetical protein
MKLIKLFLISVVVLFLLMTAFSSLLPSTVRISRAVDINDSPANVLLKISNMQQWEQWNEYTRAIPVKEVTNNSIQSKVLSVSIKLSGQSSVTTNWQQNNGTPFPGTFNIFPNNSITTVQWYFEFNIKWYPWEKFGSIIYDNQLGPPMQKSLQNLKQLLEKAP